MGWPATIGAEYVKRYGEPEAVGDYVAGPNHVLPAGQTARFTSGLSVDDFIKKSSVIYLDQPGFESLAEAAMLLAQEEGLDGNWDQAFFFEKGAEEQRQKGKAGARS